jgi:hypothetical protein
VIQARYSETCGVIKDIQLRSYGFSTYMPLFKQICRGEAGNSVHHAFRLTCLILPLADCVEEVLCIQREQALQKGAGFKDVYMREF